MVTSLLGRPRYINCTERRNADRHSKVGSGSVWGLSATKKSRDGPQIGTPRLSRLDSPRHHIHSKMTHYLISASPVQ
jgi:hypothetical protein